MIFSIPVCGDHDYRRLIRQSFIDSGRRKNKKIESYSYERQCDLHPERQNESHSSLLSRHDVCVGGEES